MENIFENAYFGKPYKTRDGSKAIYHHKRKEEHILIFESKLCAFVYDDDGHYKSPNNSALDVISEWTIDREELYELAFEYAENDDTLHPGCAVYCAYIAGYRKAMEKTK